MTEIALSICAVFACVAFVAHTFMFGRDLVAVQDQSRKELNEERRYSGQLFQALVSFVMGNVNPRDIRTMVAQGMSPEEATEEAARSANIFPLPRKRNPRTDEEEASIQERRFRAALGQIGVNVGTGAGPGPMERAGQPGGDGAEAGVTSPTRPQASPPGRPPPSTA